MQRAVGLGLLTSVLLLLACGAADRATWRVDQVHSTMRIDGAHASLNCDDCHQGKPYDQATSGCADCHLTAFQNSTFDHGAFGASTDCAVCHSTTAWSPANFSHDSFGFALTGRHRQVGCTKCHLDGTWPGQPTDCRTCHWTRHEDDPWRLALGDSCGECHTTAGWGGAPFDHLARTGFALAGAHAGAPCVSCHPNHDATTTPTGCIDCHRGDVNNTVFDHAAVGDTTQCSECHTTTAWSPATFDHDTFGFALTGRHVQVACRDCHLGGVWPGQPTDCRTCHWTRHEDDPWRLALGEACETCHNTAGWAGAPYDHLAQTGFALAGGHATIACVSCHANHDATTTPAGCGDCHAARGVSAGHPAFATDCETCHTVTAWTPSTYSHETAFPIARGKHSGFTCLRCHDGTTWQGFTCLASCHARTGTDREHREVQNYSWVSSECYRCHPRGSGGDGK
jgi:hypothetical protein